MQKSLAWKVCTQPANAIKTSLNNSLITKVYNKYVFNKRGIFITFEGPDNTGKTTQIHKLAERMTKEGYQVIVTREPGGIPISEELRNMMHTYECDPKTELLLMMAARLEHIKHKIKPALVEGKIVLCDRFTDSTYVYQGYVKGVALEDIWYIEKMINAPKPDYVLLFAHRYSNIKRDRLECVDQIAVEDGFLARRDDNWIIAPSGTKAHIAEQIWQELQTRFNKLRDISE